MIYITIDSRIKNQTIEYWEVLSNKKGPKVDGFVKLKIIDIFENKYRKQKVYVVQQKNSQGELIPNVYEIKRRI